MIRTLILLCFVESFCIANDRPVIGVLQLNLDASTILSDTYGQSHSSYLPASYVKWIESGGARVVPIKIGAKRDYYRDIMSKLNGVLLPGGAADVNTQNGFIDNAKEIISIAMEMNLRNEFFPIFGVGIGMDLLLTATNGGFDATTQCDVGSASLSLLLSDEAHKTALYNSTSQHIRRLMQNHPVANFNTKRCLRLDDFKNSALSGSWIPFSENIDRKGTVLVSTVEHVKFPFYGFSMHYERTSFEWPKHDQYPHSLATVEVSQFFANYFVNEARKNENQFNNEDELLNLLIENHAKVVSAKDDVKFFELYLFKKN